MPIVIQVDNFRDLLDRELGAGVAAGVDLLLPSQGLVEHKIAQKLRDGLEKEGVRARVSVVGSAPSGASPFVPVAAAFGVGAVVGGIVGAIAKR